MSENCTSLVKLVEWHNVSFPPPRMRGVLRDGLVLPVTAAICQNENLLKSSMDVGEPSIWYETWYTQTTDNAQFRGDPMLVKKGYWRVNTEGMLCFFPGMHRAS
jgi:hypothetical protein